MNSSKHRTHIAGNFSAHHVMRMGGSQMNMREHSITAELNRAGLHVATPLPGAQRTAMLGFDGRERQMTAQLNQDQMNQTVALNSGVALPEG